MRRGIGAIVTTGVALVGATVVVTNPIVAPPADVQVPAVALSAGVGASAAALDQSLLNAIAQDPAQAGPAEVLKRLLARFVADAALLGGRAVDEAFWAQAEFSAPPASTVIAKPDLPSVNRLLRDVPGVRVDSVAADIPAPLLRRMVTSMINAVERAGVQTIAVAAPRLVAEVLAALSHGDADRAIATVLQAVAAPPVPSTIVAVGRASISDPAAAVAGSGRRVATPPVRAAIAGEPARAKPAKSTAVNAATDPGAGKTSVPRSSSGRGQVPRKVAAAVGSARTSADRLGTAIRKAISPHRP